MNKPWLDESSDIIKTLIKRGAVFVVNHSGGKDSQAMFNYLHRFVPHEQLIVIHAELAKVEWDGVTEHIENTTFGIPILKCKSKRDLLQMIEQRGMFPSPKYRQSVGQLLFCNIKTRPDRKNYKGYR